MERPAVSIYVVSSNIYAILGGVLRMARRWLVYVHQAEDERGIQCAMFKTMCCGLDGCDRREMMYVW